MNRRNLKIDTSEKDNSKKGKTRGWENIKKTILKRKNPKMNKIGKGI